MLDYRTRECSNTRANVNYNCICLPMVVLHGPFALWMIALFISSRCLTPKSIVFAVTSSTVALLWPSPKIFP